MVEGKESTIIDLNQFITSLIQKHAQLKMSSYDRRDYGLQEERPAGRCKL